ncbi:hypothetical protein ACK1X7_48225 [Streptomyces sp. CY1]|uniref:hypothetical protein n=1 Tax=Streptomyces sp. CY1 TaxID=3388313 RepID=UPI0039A3BD55
MYGISRWRRTAPNTALNTTEQRRTPPTGRTVVTSNVGHNDALRGNALLLDTRPAAQRPVEQLRDGLAAGPGRAGVTAVALEARQAGTESGAGLAWRRARANAPAGSPEAVRACDQ